jgi:hypothetical protein
MSQTKPSPSTGGEMTTKIATLAGDEVSSVQGEIGGSAPGENARKTPSSPPGQAYCNRRSLVVGAGSGVVEEFGAGRRRRRNWPTASALPQRGKHDDLRRRTCAGNHRRYAFVRLVVDLAGRLR